jgi:probable F420-dependent oxidoreductase
MRNPVQLAWEATTIDHLSGGRFELGLGAGHSPQEYAATGIALDPAPTRKTHLAERVEIIRRLLDGDTVNHELGHHHLVNASVPRSRQTRLPILVAGNGTALLQHAAAQADIVGLQGLGRTRADGHRHDVRWSPRHLDSQIEQIRAGAGQRFPELELNALVQVVDVTDDAKRSLHGFCQEVDGLDVAHAAAVPYTLIGTPEQIIAKAHACRRRWGISYFAVRTLDEFAPIIEANYWTGEAGA